MINQQLLDFIKSQLLKGVNKDTIINELKGAGWLEKDIEEGFNSTNFPIVESTMNPTINSEMSSFVNSPVLSQKKNNLGKKILLILIIFVIIVGVIWYYFGDKISINFFYKQDKILKLNQDAEQPQYVFSTIEDKNIINNNDQISNPTEEKLINNKIQESLNNNQNPSKFIKFIKGFENLMNQSASCIIQSSDGGYVFVAKKSNNDIYILKLKSDGESLDTSFGKDGKVNLENKEVSFLSQTKDGGYIFAGDMYYNGKSGMYISKIKTDGSLDTSFGSDGIFIVKGDVATFRSNDFSSAFLTKDEGIILAGTLSAGAGSYTYLVKLTANGSLDTSFGGKKVFIEDDEIKGAQIYNQPENIFPERFFSPGFVFQTNDGGYVLTIRKDNFISYIYKLKKDGSFDNSFGTNGVFHIDENSFEGFNPFMGFISQDKNDNYILVDNGFGIDFNERSDSDIYVYKLKKDGSFDNSFGVKGKVTIGDYGMQSVNGFTETKDGGYIISGSNISSQEINFYDVVKDPVADLYIFKLTANGSLDTSFGNKGKIIVEKLSYGGDYLLNSIVQTNDGGYVTSGKSNSKDEGITIIKMDKNGNYK